MELTNILLILLAIVLSVPLFIIGSQYPKKFFFIALVLVLLWPSYIKVNIPSIASLGLDRIILFCMFIYLFLNVFSHGVTKHSNIKLYFLIAIWFCITSITSPYETYKSIGASVNWFFFGPLLSAYIYIFMKEDTIKIVNCLFWCLVCLNTIGLLEVFLQKSLFGSFLISVDDFNQGQFEGVFRDGSYRVKSVFTHPLVYAQFMLVGLSISYYYLFNKPFKIITFIYILISYFILYHTDSRAGLALSLIIPFIIFYIKYYSNDNYRKYIKFFYFFGIIGATLLTSFLISNSIDIARNMHSLNVHGGFDSQQMSSLARVLQLDLGWEAIKQSPVFGYGLRQAAQAIQRVAIDNLYLSYIIEVGFIGFLMIVILIYRGVVPGLKGIIDFKDPLLISLLSSVILILLFYFILSIPRANILLFVLLALIKTRYDGLKRKAYNDKN
jgi:O-antigen ligase